MKNLVLVLKLDIETAKQDVGQRITILGHFLENFVRLSVSPGTPSHHSLQQIVTLSLDQGLQDCQRESS